MRYTIKLSKIKWYENELQKAKSIQYDWLKLWLIKIIKASVFWVKYCIWTSFIANYITVYPFVKIFNSFILCIRHNLGSDKLEK